MRWVEFLSYIVALVYHARSEEEHPELCDVMERSVQTAPHREEYQKMGRTIAEMYIDQGRDEGKQEGALEKLRATLIRQIRKRFKKMPRKVETRIAATTSIQDLEAWLDNFANAATMADVGIPVD